jgi:hypothetical protein
MADKKITQLPSLSFISGSNTGYYAGEVVLPIVHNSTTVKMEAQKFALYATQWSATTASNTFIGNQTVNGNVTVTGKITAEEFFTEITSASIIFQSGSTLFGNSADDTHTFTGTININGKVVGNAPLDFTSQSLNIATGSYNRLYNMTSSVHSTTASLNTQTGSQQLINIQNSTVTSSLNLSTASLNFTTGALNSFSGSIIGQVNTISTFTASVNFTTQSLNTQTGSQYLINLRIGSTTSSINNTTSSFDSVFLRISSTTGSINITTSSFNSEFGKIGSTTSSIHFTTQSLNTQTGSQSNLNAQIGIATGSLNAFTSSVIGQTNTISTFTGSVNFTTKSLNTQTGSQELVNYQNSIITSSYRIELNSIEAYTSSLKNALTVNGSNIQIIGELNVSKLNVQYITSSVLFVTGSNIVGDQSTDKHEFTGSVNIKDTLFINGQAIGTGELNAQTASQDLVNRRISSTTGSINTTTSSFNSVFLGISSVTGAMNTQSSSQDIVNFNNSKVTASIDSHILKQATQTGSQDLVNLGISTSTGSLIGITNGIMAFTASLDNTYATDAQLYQLYQATRSLELHSGSMVGITNGIMALTASMKGQAIVSSSVQIQNYNLFAQTASANTFYGNQIFSGSVYVSGSVYGNVTAQPVASNTSSIDISTANFFTITLGSGTGTSGLTTHISASNMRPGQSVNILVTTGTNSSASFSTNIKQPSGSFYQPTSGSGNKDILSLVSFDTTSLYLVAVNQMI